jgi:glyoxylase-like metal-dependent hydrolase (beta-lactamase superfamily II)
MQIRTLDLEFFRTGTIAAYLVESGGDLALIETGPDSTFPSLVAALARHGVKPSDVRTVLVTHIHLDHAGAAWRMAREGATVRVHPRGAAHLLDPSKLLASARRIYRERMDGLWGTLEPIPADRLEVTGDGQAIPVGKTAIHVLETPGHAVHHNAYLVEGVAFTGDVGGVAIGGGPVLPPTPPPDIDLAAWSRSIERIRAARPDALYPTHFGRVENPDEALDGLGRELSAWADFVRAGLAAGKDEAALVPEFEEWLEGRLVVAGVPAEGREAYRTALPFAMNVGGLVRYWQKAGTPLESSAP